MPPGFRAQELFDLSRNHYDRVGHFAQGLIPAIAVREMLIRTSPLKSGAWLGFLTVTTCLAISACCEFLATQGDIRDTHRDMLLALTGAITSVALLSRAHDRALARMGAA